MTNQCFYLTFSWFINNLWISVYTEVTVLFMYKTVSMQMNLVAHHEVLKTLKLPLTRCNILVVYARQGAWFWGRNCYVKKILNVVWKQDFMKKLSQKFKKSQVHKFTINPNYCQINSNEDSNAMSCTETIFSNIATVWREPDFGLTVTVPSFSNWRSHSYGYNFSIL